MRTGKIVDLQGNWGSGVAMLSLETEEGVEHIPCDNAPTVRALDAMFDCVVSGHSVDVSALVGKEIAFEMDEMGLMLGAIGWPEGVEEYDG